MRCVYLEIIEEISLPKPPFVPMLLASTQTTGQYFSYMQPLFDEFGGKFGFSEVFLGQYGKYSGWTEIFISFAMVKDIHQKVPLKHLDSLGRQLIDC